MGPGPMTTARAIAGRRCGPPSTVTSVPPEPSAQNSLYPALESWLPARMRVLCSQSLCPPGRGGPHRSHVCQTAERLSAQHRLCRPRQAQDGPVPGVALGSRRSSCTSAPGTGTEGTAQGSTMPDPVGGVALPPRTGLGVSTEEPSHANTIHSSKNSIEGHLGGSAEASVFSLGYDLRVLGSNPISGSLVSTESASPSAPQLACVHALAL